MDNNLREKKYAPTSRVCSVCSAELVQATQELAGIHRRSKYVELVGLNCYTTMVCPKRTGVYGFVYFRHDRRVFIGDTEVVLDEDEFMLVV